MRDPSASARRDVVLKAVKRGDTYNAETGDGRAEQIRQWTVNVQVASFDKSGLGEVVGRKLDGGAHSGSEDGSVDS
jgi:phage-related protein